MSPSIQSAPTTTIAPSEPVNAKPMPTDAEVAGQFEQPPAPDIRHLVTEDDTPVDNLIQEKLQRLLVQCLYAAFRTEQLFVAMADVGLFYGINLPPLVPDVMLSLGIQIAEDWQQKRHRSYLMWEFGKPPEVVIEVVSNRKGQELGKKLVTYGQIGVAYYVVFDPLERLSEQPLQVYGLKEGRYQPLDTAWLPEIGLGLTVWSGTFEGKQYDRWLRWCDQAGNLLLTGSEQAEQEKQRAEQEKQRAEQEKQRAEQEKQRAEGAESQLAELLAKLQANGIDVDTLAEPDSPLSP